MNDLELAARLREVAVAGFERWRKRGGGVAGRVGAIVTPTPHRLIDEIAAGFAPVLQAMVEAAVAHRLDAPGVHNLDDPIAQWKPIDLRPGKEAT